MNTKIEISISTNMDYIQLDNLVLYLKEKLQKEVLLRPQEFEIKAWIPREEL